MVITGTSSGIGVETTRALSITGATLFLTARDMKRAETALAGILEPGCVSLVEMDKSSFTSIRAAATNILRESNGQVNTLINIAGVLGFEKIQLTNEGYEMHFSTNQLGHFLLFQLLKPALLTSSTPNFHSRTVIVASSAHRAYGINESDNYNFQNGGYSYMLAYSQSKTANIYMANELDRRYGYRDLHATSVHPGGIATRLSRHLGSAFVEQFMKDEKLVKNLKSPEQGAATTIVTAVGEEWGDRGGRYLENCEEALRGEGDCNALGTGFVSHTYDQKKEERLWRDSLRSAKLYPTTSLTVVSLIDTRVSIKIPVSCANGFRQLHHTNL